MAQQDGNLQDEFLPELEISLTPCKLSDNLKVDLFGLDERFLTYLAVQGILPGEYGDDVQVMSLPKAVKLITDIRGAYRRYRATGNQ